VRRLTSPESVSSAYRGESGSDRATAAALGAALFVVYSLGAARTIYVGDSGELTAAAAVLGIPHPSGYPLYVLLGKLWTLLFPFGSIAARMSLFSAAAAAASCALLYLLCRRMAFTAMASLFGTTLLAFSPSFWGEANVQRTYALNALFLVLAALLLHRWMQSRSTSHLCALFFVCGLGACNHLFMVVAWICAGTIVAVRSARLAPLPLAAAARAALAAFALGLLPYLYLPLRSRFDPVVDWGNPETLSSFMAVVFRSDFWGRAWVQSPGDLLAVVSDWALSLGTETAWVGAALAIAGCVVLLRSPSAEGTTSGGRGMLAFAALTMLFNVAILAAHGARSDLFLWHRYYIPSYAMMALLSAAGCAALLARIPRLLRPAIAIVPLFLLATGWGAADRSRYRIADEFSRNLLEALPPGSHLIASDDNILFPLMYLHLVEKVRPDVNLVMQGVGAGPPPLRVDPDDEPLFLTHHPNWTLPEIVIHPVGPVFQATRTGSSRPEPLRLPQSLDGEDDARVPKDDLTRDLIGHFHYMRGVTAAETDWESARREFARAAEAAPHNDVLFHNLGLIYQRRGLVVEAETAFARSVAIDPRQRRGRP